MTSVILLNFSRVDSKVVLFFVISLYRSYDSKRGNGDSEIKLSGATLGDKVALQGGFTAGSSNGGYTTYTATHAGSTISVDIKEDVVVTL